MSKSLEPVVVSFYTPDDYYAKHAERLYNECNRLGLDSHIVEMPYQGAWLKTLRLKPNVITAAIVRNMRPALWIDVDGSIYKRPDACDPANWDYQGVPKKPEKGRPFYMGCQFFNNTGAALRFLKIWEQEYDKEDSEELSFGNSMARALSEIDFFRVGKLPPTYMEIEKNGYKRTENTVVVHRLSDGESKQEFYRQQAEKKK